MARARAKPRYFLLGPAQRLAAELPAEACPDVPTLLEALPAPQTLELPVALVLPEQPKPEATVRQLLRARPDLHVVLATEPDDRRSLGEHFRNQPVRARRVNLVPRDEEFLERVRAVGRAAVQRRVHRRALQRTAERLTQLQPQPLDLTAEPVRRAVLESLPLGVILVTREGYVAETNAAARELLRRPAADGGPEHVLELIPQLGDLDLKQRELDAVITRSSHGLTRHLRVRSVPLAAPAEQQGSVLTLEDVTEQEEARRVLKATALQLQGDVEREARQHHQVRRERDSIKHFMATLTHDLRSPVAAALMNAQVLERRMDEPDARLVRGIGRNLRRMDRMIEDLLDLTRYDTGMSLAIERRPTRLDLLMREVVEDLQAVHPVAFELREPLPAVQGEWDADGLRRVLENLANNAAKYGERARAVTLWLQDIGSAAVVHIRNFGPPIPVESQKALFEPFYRAEAPSSGRIPGWGVGLAFVRAMTESHGGSVSVTSSAEHGTTFTVQLPKQAPEPD